MMLKGGKIEEDDDSLLNSPREGVSNLEKSDSNWLNFNDQKNRGFVI
jgi:hypothetical protein